MPHLAARTALGLLLTTLATAQTPPRFVPDLPVHLPAGSASRAAAILDVDGDGNADLVLGRAGPNALLRGDGAGRFAPLTGVAWPTVALTTTRVLAADVDGDGDLDLFEAGLIVDRLLRRDAAGFTDVTTTALPLHLFDTKDAVFGDVDGDGDLDLLLAVAVGPSSLWRNDGAGRFTDVTTANLPGPALDDALSAALLDLDGDGDLDAVLGIAGAPLRLLLNDGTGRFTDVSASRAPVALPNVTAILGVDPDRDGDLDLLLGDNRVDAFWRNDGTGRFTVATGAVLPADEGVTLALAGFDADGDGDRDVLRVGRDRVELLLDDGSGRYLPAAAGRIPRLFDLVTGIASGDLDGDGDRDLLLCRPFAGDRPFFGDGTGRFLDAAAPPFPEDWRDPLDLAVADLDADGAPDVATATDGDDRVESGDGTGRFTPRAALPGAGITTALAAADVDGDGAVDLVRVGFGTPGEVLGNDGSGNLAPRAGAWPITADFAAALALGDVDGDGRPDAVVGAFSGAVLRRNDGGGRFTDAPSADWPAVGGAVLAALLVDVDGDGDRDAVLGRDGAPPLLLGNDGRGRFTIRTGALPTVATRTQSLAAADLDGDGDVDLVLGEDGIDRIFTNDGTGRFRDATASLAPTNADPTRRTDALAIADVDGDGRPDVLLGGNAGELVLWRAATAGARLVREPLAAFPGGIAALATADLDADGDVDLLVARSGRAVELWRNAGRELLLPFAPRVGRPLTVELRGPIGMASIAWLAAAPAAIPLPPFGTFRLDPGSLLTLGAAGPSGDGTARFELPVPAVPALAGLVLHVQGLVQAVPAQPSTWALTRRCAVPIDGS